MEYFDTLLLGTQAAFSADALLFCLIGVTLGTFIGVLPGLGPLATISLLLPVTFHVPASSSLIMLAGIYYGAQYGSSTASILLNIPGTATSAVTCLDGYPMAKQGRAGIALCMTTIASFVGSCFGIVLLMGFAPLLAKAALAFGPAEYFAIMVFGLVTASTMAVGSVLKGLIMVAAGIALGMVGSDVNSGIVRFTFGLPQLFDGLSLVSLAMGLFGVAEVVNNVGRTNNRSVEMKVTLRSLIPTRKDVSDSVMPIVRGSATGAGFGFLPGAGSSIATFVAYAIEKRVARDPSRFGKGAIEGVTAPEAANNAAAQSAFIPTLTLGIPGDAVMALMLGALMIHGITPGPTLLTDHGVLFWTLIASFWIGNVALVVLNLPLIGIWVRILSIPYQYLFPAILALMCVGAYSVNMSAFDVFAMIFFGVVGFGLMRLGFHPAPLLLGFVLGPLVEEYMRRALLLSKGDPLVFLERPLSAAILLATVAVVIFSLRSAMRRRAVQAAG